MEKHNRGKSWAKRIPVSTKNLQPPSAPLPPPPLFFFFLEWFMNTSGLKLGMSVGKQNWEAKTTQNTPGSHTDWSSIWGRWMQRKENPISAALVWPGSEEGSSSSLLSLPDHRAWRHKEILRGMGLLLAKEVSRITLQCAKRFRYACLGLPGLLLCRGEEKHLHESAPWQQCCQHRSSCCN